MSENALQPRPKGRRWGPVASLGVALGLAFSLAASSASGEDAEMREVEPSPVLLGIWTAEGDGIVKMVIRRSKSGWVTVRAFGACEPTLCDWGAVQARLFARKPFSAVGTGFVASYDHDFALTTVTAHVSRTSLPTLRVESYRRFVDGSKRSDYWDRVYMHRS